MKVNAPLPVFIKSPDKDRRPKWLLEFKVGESRDETDEEIDVLTDG